MGNTVKNEWLMSELEELGVDIKTEIINIRYLIKIKSPPESKQSRETVFHALLPPWDIVVL